MEIILKAQEDVLSGLKDALNKHQLKLNNTIELSGSESYKDGVNVFEKLKIIYLMLYYLLVMNKQLVFCIVLLMLE